MKSKIIKIIILIVLFTPIYVSANIVCNDGTVSKSCKDCHQGCCSRHGGCTSGGSKKSTAKSSGSSNKSTSNGKSNNSTNDSKSTNNYNSAVSGNNYLSYGSEKKDEESSSTFGKLAPYAVIIMMIYAFKKKKR